MENKKSEFTEIIADMSQSAGAFAGAAVAAGKKMMRCLCELTTPDTMVKTPADKENQTKRPK